MKKRVVNNLVLAQCSFFTFLAITIFKTTAGFKQNHGLSFYGEHWSTAVPFGAGFFFCDYFLLRAANALPKDELLYRRLSTLINILTVFLLFILLTPDTLDSFFNWSHIADSSVLFLYELGFGVWLYLRCHRDVLALVLVALLFAAGVLSMLSQFHIVYYLSEGILIFQLIFGVLLTYSVSLLLSEAPDEDTNEGPVVESTT
ncbi:MAG: hypothetical protein ABSC34_09980 [Acidimicrobiales bacterium]|jgi:hypothetical protein